MAGDRLVISCNRGGLTAEAGLPSVLPRLSALGLEFVDYTPYLLPLTAVLLGCVAVVLGLQARRTGNVYPLLVGVAASVLVLLGKFHFEAEWLTIGGIALLVAAILLGSRMKSLSTVPCPACAPGGNEPQARAH